MRDPPLFVSQVNPVYEFTNYTIIVKGNASTPTSVMYQRFSCWVDRDLSCRRLALWGITRVRC